MLYDACLTGEADPEQLLQLQLQVDGLQQQLSSKNQVIKAVIDRLRLLMDAFQLWETHGKATTGQAR
jgi:hypothetical protein